jgi:hypothetical protein
MYGDVRHFCQRNLPTSSDWAIMEFHKVKFVEAVVLSKSNTNPVRGESIITT